MNTLTLKKLEAQKAFASPNSVGLQRCKASIVFTFFIYLFLQIPFEGTMYELYNYYTTIALAGYFWIFLINAKNVNHKVNLFLIYVAITIPFYFGGQILIMLGYGHQLSEENYSLVDNRIPMQYHVEAMKYIILCLQMLNIGYLVTGGNSKGSTLFNDQKKYNYKAINRVATILLIVSFVPTMARLIYDIVMAQVLGHLGLMHAKSEEEYLGIWNIFTYIKGWFLPACLMKIACGTYKGKKIGYLFLLLYCVLYLFSGSRYEIIQVAFAVMVLYRYSSVKKIKKKKFIIIGLIAYLGLVILRSVSYTRDETGSGVSLESIIDVIGGGVFYESFFETSTTFTSVSNLLRYCPNTLPYNEGMSIVGGLIYILPDFLRPELIEHIILHISAELSPYYYGFEGAGYGSAFVTEAYFNFGYFALFYVLIIGIILRKLTDTISFSTLYNNRIGLLVCTYIMTEMIWAIRSDMYLIPRHFVYYMLLPLFFSRIFRPRKVNSIR